MEYNQPDCVKVLLDILGTKEPNKHNFVVQNNQHESLSACELAAARGEKSSLFEYIISSGVPIIYKTD